MSLIVSFGDIETTGLTVADGHRIIEFAIHHYDFATRTKVGRYVQRIDPLRPIDPEAQEVHGIAYDDLVGCPTWDVVAPAIHDEIVKTSQLTFHNRDFDFPFIEQELERVGIKPPLIETFCTMENGRWACFDGKLPKLMELCFALNVPYDPALAHAADYDVDCTAQCYFKGLERGFFPQPGSISF